MRQSPLLDMVQARMQPGRITRDGLLGNDRRSLAEILDADTNTAHSLGLTHEEVADRLDYFTKAGRKGLGTTVNVDETFEVRVESVRGFLPCPWGHPGLYPKTNVYFKNLKTGDELIWTSLQMHMIREHGFYEGRGSTFRMDLRKAKRALGLSATP